MHREPSWSVQSVFDPEGNGGDFGYTVGLAERGLPELHVWSRPSLGDDPGEDWKLSVRDIGRLLNEVAWAWVDGELRVGDRFEREYDDGLVIARFQLDPPQAAESLDAFGADNAPVVPLRWSLERPSIEPPAAMTHLEQRCAELRWLELVKDLDVARSAPPGWRLPTVPSWSVDQKYGSRTPLVLALAARLWQADAEALGGLIQVGAFVDAAGSLTYPMTIAATAARGVGRQHAVDQISDDLHTLCHELGARWLRRPFGRMQREVMGEGWTAHEQRHHADNLRHLLADVTASAACVEAVADVVSEPVRMAALGPFLAGFAGPGEAPGPEWVAPRHVVDAVGEALRGVSAMALLEVVESHVRARDDARYHEVFSWLAARAVTGSASAPPVLSLLDLEAQAPAIRALCARELGGMLQEWVTTFTSAVCCRATLAPSWVDAWTEPFASLLPGLRDVRHL